MCTDVFLIERYGIHLSAGSYFIVGFGLSVRFVDNKKNTVLPRLPVNTTVAWWTPSGQSCNMSFSRLLPLHHMDTIQILTEEQ